MVWATAKATRHGEIMISMADPEYQEADVCQRCGACCAHFRVSFYWAEGVVRGLADTAVEQVTPLLACMAGTNQPEPRCHGLEGQVGEQVSCRLYEQRPSPCRELQPGEEKCNRARARHGLPAISAG
jgi:Fe-S-cluster containining protein